jgi:hypothetical protein
MLQNQLLEGENFDEEQAVFSEDEVTSESDNDSE